MSKDLLKEFGNEYGETDRSVVVRVTWVFVNLYEGHRVSMLSALW